MSFLTDRTKEYIKQGHYLYKTCCSFDNVLEVQKMFKDERLTEVDKVEQALYMLTENKFKLWILSYKQKEELLNRIVKEQIALPRKPVIKPQQKTFDFDLDGEYIYSSFFQEYGIDLLDQQGKLHWKKFIALFQGLSDNTKMREIMKIRSMELPQYNGKNQKQIQDIQELKSYYALPVSGGGGEKGLNALFCALESMAARGEVDKIAK
ncbi:MAG: Gp15 family bacteriophage protein [Lachnospiraceae bacterium]|nr:MAG TPA: hypothetical protein [Caudoviricetes sp.]